MEISFYNVRQSEGIFDELNIIKETLENKINLSRTIGKEKRVTLTNNKVMRICFIVGLSQAGQRNLDEVANIQLSKASTRYVPSFFTMNNLSTLYSALLKLRYKEHSIDWTDNPLLSRIIASEMLRGRNFLMDENNLNGFLYSIASGNKNNGSIPALELLIGEYDEEMEDLKSSDLDKVVPLFTKKAQGMTKDYLSLMVRNLNRFIDTEIRMEELYIKDEISIDKAACQSMFGDHELFVGFVGGQAGLVHIGSQFAKEEFTEVDEDVLDSICEFINTINGLFASSLSENEIDMDMHPPMMAMDAKVVRSDELYVLPVFLSGKKVELVLALDKKVIVE